MVDDSISPDDKASLCARLISLAPPCECFEVLDDIRFLVGNDVQIQKKLSAAISHYNKEQMISVELPNSEYPTLITSYGDLGGGYFMCPRNQVSFHYDHIKQTISDVKRLEPKSNDLNGCDLDPWRLALENELTKYIGEHFPSGGVSVYVHTDKNEDQSIVACIQAYYCRQLSTGRWRSKWVLKLNGQPPHGKFSIHGTIKVQTHLYEDGNVQLISAKEIDMNLPASRPTEFAIQCVAAIKERDFEYQTAVDENFTTMSDTTFKALRRQLPLTKTKFEWDKIITYQIGNEISRAPP